MDILKKHPFALEAFFENSTVLTFAAPLDQLQALIPKKLTLDTFQDQWGFIAVAMVQTKSLRPKGFPKWMGNDFFLIGYRVFVNYQTLLGKRYRGLYILTSETDSKRMKFFGNLFTNYNYKTTDISIIQNENLKEIRSKKSNFNITIDTAVEEILLPKDSPFTNWKEARKYAGPLPFTFTVNESQDKVLYITGVRQHWKPKAIHVEDYQFEFLNSLSIPDLVLANAFQIEGVPYHWEKGIIEHWNA